jgi:hypothetical protein
MKPILQLNLNDTSEKAEAPNLPSTNQVEPEPEVVRKRLDQIANRAAHKAAAEYGQYSSSIFSK